MRKLTTILLSVLLTLLFASQFLSCEKYVLPELSISPDTLWFSAAADSQVVLLVTNVITTAEPENAGWLYAPRVRAARSSLSNRNPSSTT